MATHKDFSASALVARTLREHEGKEDVRVTHMRTLWETRFYPSKWSRSEGGATVELSVFHSKDIDLFNELFTCANRCALREVIPSLEIAPLYLGVFTIGFTLTIPVDVKQ